MPICSTFMVHKGARECTLGLTDLMNSTSQVNHSYHLLTLVITSELREV